MSGGEVRRRRVGSRVGVGVGVLAVLAAVVAGANIRWEEVLAELFAADPVFVVLALAASLLAQVAWAGVTATTLRVVVPEAPTGRIRLGYLCGTFAKQVLPFGHAGGVPLLAYVISQDLETDYRTVFASVTASELVIFAASVVVALVGAVSFLFTGRVPLWTGLLALGTACGGAAVAVVVGRRAVHRGLLTRVALAVAAVGRVTVGGPVPRVRRALAPEAVRQALAGFADTFARATADRAVLGRAVGLALLGWVAFGLPLYLAFAAIGAGFPLALALVLVPAAGLASLLPTPGGLGGAEVGTVAAAVLLTGVGVESATAAVVVYRLATYWFVVLVGGAAAVYLSVGLVDLRPNA